MTETCSIDTRQAPADTGQRRGEDEGISIQISKTRLVICARKRQIHIRERHNHKRDESRQRRGKDETTWGVAETRHRDPETYVGYVHTNRGMCFTRRVWQRNSMAEMEGGRYR